ANGFVWLSYFTAPGWYNITAGAIDAAGNVGETIGGYLVLVDNTGPRITAFIEPQLHPQLLLNVTSRMLSFMINATEDVSNITGAQFFIKNYTGSGDQGLVLAWQSTCAAGSRMVSIRANVDVSAFNDGRYEGRFEIESRGGITASSWCQFILDRAPPVGTFVLPTAGSVLFRTLNAVIQCFDTSGIRSVEVYASGAYLGACGPLPSMPNTWSRLVTFKEDFEGNLTARIHDYIGNWREISVSNISIIGILHQDINLTFAGVYGSTFTTSGTLPSAELNNYHAVGYDGVQVQMSYHSYSNTDVLPFTLNFDFTTAAPGWIANLGNSDQTVASPKSGCLRYSGNTGFYVPAEYRTMIESVEFKVRSDPDGVADVFLLNDYTSPGEPIFRFKVGNSGVSVINLGTIGYGAPGSWYAIAVKNIDFELRKADIFFNGACVAKDQSFENALGGRRYRGGVNLALVKFFNEIYPSKSTCLDDVKIAGKSPVNWIPIGISALIPTGGSADESWQITWQTEALDASTSTNWLPVSLDAFHTYDTAQTRNLGTLAQLDADMASEVVIMTPKKVINQIGQFIPSTIYIYKQEVAGSVSAWIRTVACTNYLPSPSDTAIPLRAMPVDLNQDGIDELVVLTSRHLIVIKNLMAVPEISTIEVSSGGVAKDVEYSGGKLHVIDGEQIKHISYDASLPVASRLILGIDTIIPGGQLVGLDAALLDSTNTSSICLFYATSSSIGYIDANNEKHEIGNTISTNKLMDAGDIDGDGIAEVVVGLDYPGGGSRSALAFYDRVSMDEWTAYQIHDYGQHVDFSRMSIKQALATCGNIDILAASSQNVLDFQLKNAITTTTTSAQLGNLGSRTMQQDGGLSSETLQSFSSFTGLNQAGIESYAVSPGNYVFGAPDLTPNTFSASGMLKSVDILPDASWTRSVLQSSSNINAQSGLGFAQAGYTTGSLTGAVAYRNQFTGSGAIPFDSGKMPQGIVINEVKIGATPQTDIIELYNYGAAVNLDGWKVIVPDRILSLPSLVLGSGQFMYLYSNTGTSSGLTRYFGVSFFQTIKYELCVILANAQKCVVDCIISPGLDLKAIAESRSSCMTLPADPMAVWSDPYNMWEYAYGYYRYTDRDTNSPAEWSPKGFSTSFFYGLNPDYYREFPGQRGVSPYAYDPLSDYGNDARQYGTAFPLAHGPDYGNAYLDGQEYLFDGDLATGPKISQTSKISGTNTYCIDLYRSMGESSRYGFICRSGSSGQVSFDSEWFHAGTGGYSEGVRGLGWSITTKDYLLGSGIATRLDDAVNMSSATVSWGTQFSSPPGFTDDIYSHQITSYNNESYLDEPMGLDFDLRDRLSASYLGSIDDGDAVLTLTVRAFSIYEHRAEYWYQRADGQNDFDGFISYYILVPTRVYVGNYYDSLTWQELIWTRHDGNRSNALWDDSFGNLAKDAGGIANLLPQYPDNVYVPGRGIANNSAPVVWVEAGKESANARVPERCAVWNLLDSCTTEIQLSPAQAHLLVDNNYQIILDSRLPYQTEIELENNYPWWGNGTGFITWSDNPAADSYLGEQRWFRPSSYSGYYRAVPGRRMTFIDQASIEVEGLAGINDIADYTNLSNSLEGEGYRELDSQTSIPIALDLTKNLFANGRPEDIIGNFKHIILEPTFSLQGSAVIGEPARAGLVVPEIMFKIGSNPCGTYSNIVSNQWMYDPSQAIGIDDSGRPYKIGQSHLTMQVVQAAQIVVKSQNANRTDLYFDQTDLIKNVSGMNNDIVTLQLDLADIFNIGGYSIHDYVTARGILQLEVRFNSTVHVKIKDYPTSWPSLPGGATGYPILGSGKWNSHFNLFRYDQTVTLGELGIVANVDDTFMTSWPAYYSDSEHQVAYTIPVSSFCASNFNPSNFSRAYQYWFTLDFQPRIGWIDSRMPAVTSSTVGYGYESDPFATIGSDNLTLSDLVTYTVAFEIYDWSTGWQAFPVFADLDGDTTLDDLTTIARDLPDISSGAIRAYCILQDDLNYDLPRLLSASSGIKTRLAVTMHWQNAGAYDYKNMQHPSIPNAVKRTEVEIQSFDLSVKYMGNPAPVTGASEVSSDSYTFSIPQTGQLASSWSGHLYPDAETSFLVDISLENVVVSQFSSITISVDVYAQYRNITSPYDLIKHKTRTVNLTLADFGPGVNTRTIPVTIDGSDFYLDGEIPLTADHFATIGTDFLGDRTIIIEARVVSGTWNGLVSIPSMARLDVQLHDPTLESDAITTAFTYQFKNASNAASSTLVEEFSFMTAQPSPEFLLVSFEGDFDLEYWTDSPEPGMPFAPATVSLRGSTPPEFMQFLEQNGDGRVSMVQIFDQSEGVWRNTLSTLGSSPILQKLGLTNTFAFVYYGGLTSGLHPCSDFIDDNTGEVRARAILDFAEFLVTNPNATGYTLSLGVTSANLIAFWLDPMKLNGVLNFRS
nr:hypothetical protein [Candidatus Sigynarchaeota archaeon]